MNFEFSLTTKEMKIFRILVLVILAKRNGIMMEKVIFFIKKKDIYIYKTVGF